MNPRVVAVQANPDYTLTILFTSGESKRFDVKPYLDKGIFRELRDPVAFRRVKPFLGSIQWAGGQDLCPDTLYEESEPDRGRQEDEMGVTEQAAAPDRDSAPLHPGR
ncbi:MAG: DUF2442 domain-containing protein [Nitrospinae bacterium]|nr:DUF2442 domain-containing protein [Nitrospinota bacterium]